MQIYQTFNTQLLLVCDLPQVWIRCRSIKGLPLACVMWHRCESDADLSKAYHWHVWCDTGVNRMQIYQRLTTGECDVPQVWIWCWETRATLDWNTTPIAMQHPNQINQCMHKWENQMLRRHELKQRVTTHTQNVKVQLNLCTEQSQQKQQSQSSKTINYKGYFPFITLSVSHSHSLFITSTSIH